ncbi:MAG: MopE-related protein [bacterium]|nr:MopE-related protein [bacterium]
MRTVWLVLSMITALITAVQACGSDMPEGSFPVGDDDSVATSVDDDTMAADDDGVITDDDSQATANDDGDTSDDDAVSADDDSGDDATECSEERCDSIDNDCDGITDNGPWEEQACYMEYWDAVNAGLRTCGAPGTEGVPHTTLSCGLPIAGGPSCEENVELCHDRADNDCDGMVDWDDGDCVFDSTAACPMEICDGVDNDCDGVTDDGDWIGVICIWENDGLLQEGFWECDAPVALLTCDPACNEEVCNDHVDNDCDRLIDTDDLEECAAWAEFLSGD